MYKVISRFADLQDGCYVYEVGDTFPHADIAITAERYAELAGYHNKLKKPLIQAVTENPESVEKPKRKSRRKEREANGTDHDGTLSKPEKLV